MQKTYIFKDQAAYAGSIFYGIMAVIGYIILVLIAFVESKTIHPATCRKIMARKNAYDNKSYLNFTREEYLHDKREREICYGGYTLYYTLKIMDIMKNFIRNLKLLIPDWIVVSRRFRKFHGRWPNLLRPKTFSEKIAHRIIFDHRPILTTLADKVASRDYIAERLGSQVLPKLYYVGQNPQEALRLSPDRVVIKASHGSGYVKILTSVRQMDMNAVANFGLHYWNKWKFENFYHQTREWPYKGIQPQLMAEEFIDDGNGESPNDYKFFVFGGRVELIQVDGSRFTGHKRSFMSRTWDKLDLLLTYSGIEGDIPRPPHLDEMIAAAEKLGQGMDFIRVDLYDTHAQFYAGEITTTPGCGCEIFQPAGFDEYLGSLWKLP